MFICIYAGGACAVRGWGGGGEGYKNLFMSGLSPRLGGGSVRVSTHITAGKPQSVIGQLGASSLLTRWKGTLTLSRSRSVLYKVIPLGSVADP
jgi:hypothetical protein